MVLETIALPTELYPSVTCTSIFGGEDGIRTHAALTNPNDLANRPLEPLEYFSINITGGEGGIRTHGPFRNHWFSRPAP